MARWFNGTTQYFESSSPPLTAAPLTMAAWFNATNITAGHTIIELVNSASPDGNDGFFLLARGDVGGDPVQAQTGGTGGGGTYSFASSPTAYTAGSWQHAAATFASASSRIAYLNGKAGTEETTSRTPSGINRLNIGALRQTSTLLLLSGMLAHVGIWNVALSKGEIQQLASGVPCDKVCPARLVAYWPFSTQSLDMVAGKYNLIATAGPGFANTPSFADRRRSYRRRFNPPLRKPSSAAAGGPFPWFMDEMSGGLSTLGMVA